MILAVAFFANAARYGVIIKWSCYVNVVMQALPDTSTDITDVE
jgi:hypothetical protein